MSSVARRSGLQKDILALYRRALRIPRHKPVATQEKFYVLIRGTLRDMATSVGPRDISAIEFLMRRATRMCEGWEDPGVRDCWLQADQKNGAGRALRYQTP
ncbi:hypothetical protein SISNIDRAFT_456050 [Sistotremastrum niveocremeum HHB9708]|uniref:Uncharacterized protein n=2 Tax=Sistotremastraceae TaxID=3402574 RepID=A0A164TE16_9AGAM|nr:hypothetical protein SISNIDRAFT_456050 [Sistotremastrum niveocremeum HHB9708]KZT38906.1 hypothetical protein SISSUDRAFT_1046387 [Sistotremastrum suecicum HHB10207 ss-3]